MEKLLVLMAVPFILAFTGGSWVRGGGLLAQADAAKIVLVLRTDIGAGHIFPYLVILPLNSGEEVPKTLGQTPHQASRPATETPTSIPTGGLPADHSSEDNIRNLMELLRRAMEMELYAEAALGAAEATWLHTVDLAAHNPTSPNFRLQKTIAEQEYEKALQSIRTAEDKVAQLAGLLEQEHRLQRLRGAA